MTVTILTPARKRRIARAIRRTELGYLAKNGPLTVYKIGSPHPDTIPPQAPTP